MEVQLPACANSRTPANSTEYSNGYSGVLQFFDVSRFCGFVLASAPPEVADDGLSFQICPQAHAPGSAMVEAVRSQLLGWQGPA